VGKVPTGRELHQSCSPIVTGLQHLLPQFDIAVEEQRDEPRFPHCLCHLCSCILCHWFFSFKCYRATLPEASPPINFSTSSTVTRFASPLMVCFRQEAATAKSSAFWSSPSYFINP